MSALRIADTAHNLPFIQACAVLHETLRARFDPKGTLGGLVKASEKKLTWKDYSTIQEIVEKRNEVAHEAKILSKDDCWRYIDAIGAELAAWGIIPAA